jgi:hypothetical protein
VEQAGQEIVNSISIHKLAGDREEGTLDDVVAVITNNDKSIRVFSLTSHSQTGLFELPFAVNHATISPDGRILVAVGDYQQAYFYERVDHPRADSKRMHYASACCVWELLNIVALHVPRNITATGYFSTAWSPSGRLCAVASECGYVSVIDMAALHEFEDAEDAIVSVQMSTRPDVIHTSGAIPGAVRSMIFSPSPWDLLIWAEDQGRVCLADLRTGLKTRQILKLEPEQEGCKRVDMEINASENYVRRNDSELERDYIRNFRTYRSLADDPVEGGFDIDHELAIAETRTLAEGRSMARAALRLADDSQLSRRERELLDSLRTTAQQEERSSTNSPVPPRSIHYPEHDPRRSTAQQSALFTQDFPTLARQNDEPNTTSGTLRIMRDYMRERSTEFSNGPLVPSGARGTWSHNSIRDQELDDALAATATSTATEAQPPTLSDRATLFSAAQTDLTRSSASRLLSTLRSSPHIPTPTPPLLNPTAALPLPSSSTDLDAVDARRRRAILRARGNANRPSEEGRYHARLGIGGVTRGDFYDPGLGLRTAGLAMSGDGRRLWAACDKGIFEFEVNVAGRMGMPGFEVK